MPLQRPLLLALIIPLPIKSRFTWQLQFLLATAISGTISLDTPPAVVPLTEKITAFYYVKNKLINTATYPSLGTTLIPFPIPTWTLTADSLVQGAFATYTLSMVINYNIPYGGAILVKIPMTYGFSSPTLCTNDAVDGSTLQDDGLVCSVDITTGYMVVSGFPEFVAPALVVLQVQLTNPAVTQPADWTAATYYTDATPLATTICQNTAIVPPTLTPTTPTPPATWDTQYWYRTLCHVNQNCPLEFIVDLKTALTTSDTIQMTINLGFTLAPEGQVFCYWNNDVTQYSFPACTWTVGGTYTTLVIHSPSGVTMAASANTPLTVTTLNANKGLNGIVMPTTPQNYTFTVARMTGGSTQEEVSSVSVEVLMTAFTAYQSKALVVNYNQLSAIAIQFTPSTTIPVSTGSLVVTLPTKTPDGVTLYADDLGSGIANGGTFPCSEPTSTWVCTIAYGDQGTGKAVTITATGWTSALAAGTSYRFILSQVYNTAAADNKHVYVKLQSYSSSTPLNADIMYDFTMQDWTSTSYTGPGTPTTSTPVAGSTGVSFTLTLTTNDPLGYVASHIYDYFIIQFPTLVTVPMTVDCSDGAGTYYTCEAVPGNHWVVLYSFGGNLASGATRSVQIGQADQAQGIMNFQFEVLAVKYRAISCIYTYAAISMTGFTINAFVNPLVKTKDVTLPYIPASTKLQFLITFSTMTGSGSITIPSTGMLEIIPSTNLASSGIDTFCEATTGLTGNVQCVCTSTSCLITNFGAISAGTAIGISLWATTGATATNANWAINAYLDTAKTVKVFTSTAITGDAITATYAGFKQVYVPDTQPQNIVTTRAGGKGKFEFEFTPGATWAATSYITITFPTAASVSIPSGATLFCGFDGMEASLCTATSTSPLTISMYAPQTPSLVSTTTNRAWITTQGDTDTSTTNGLIFTYKGDYVAVVAFGATNYNIPFRILAATDFTSLALLPFWSNAGAVNHLGVTFTPSYYYPT